MPYCQMVNSTRSPALTCRVDAAGGEGQGHPVHLRVRDIWQVPLHALARGHKRASGVSEAHALPPTGPACKHTGTAEGSAGSARALHLLLLRAGLAGSGGGVREAVDQQRRVGETRIVRRGVVVNGLKGRAERLPGGGDGGRAGEVILPGGEEAGLDASADEGGGKRP